MHWSVIQEYLNSVRKLLYITVNNNNNVSIIPCTHYTVLLHVHVYTNECTYMYAHTHTHTNHYPKRVTASLMKAIELLQVSLKGHPILTSIQQCC